MKTTNYKTIHKIMYWIVTCWFRRIPSSITLAETWINQVHAWELSNGPIWTIKHIKMIRQLVFSFLSDKPQKEVKQIIGINRSNGLPKSITYLHKLIESRDPNSIRFILTLLSISRAIPGWVEPSLETIERPSNPSKPLIMELENYMPIFLRNNAWKNTIPQHFFPRENLMFSSKAGPNGSATRTSLFDLAIMPTELRKILSELNVGAMLTEFEKLLTPNRVKFYHAVQQNWTKYINLTKKDKTISPSWFDKFRKDSIKGEVRKLSIVQDPEAKSRIIAIFDFWSQTWLRQIHKIHFNFLRGIPTDRTFTQDPIILDKPEGHKYYSFDLSAATDRFPIDLQRRMIESMFDKSTSEKWEKILTAFPFYVPWEDRYIKYAAGQPMGAYSSWSTFTITHHLVLQYIHFQLDLEKFYYQILGDDIVIYHDKVAEEYQRIMKELEVEISIPKSNISSNMYEFAKRIFISGTEVTGIQLRGLIDNYNKYHLIYQMIYEIVYERKYYPLGLISIPEMIYTLMRITGMKEKQALNIKSRVLLLHSFNKFLRGEVTPFIERIKALYPNYEGQLQFPEIEINNYVYLALDDTLRKVNAEYINYANDLVTKPSLVEQAAIGLADQADIFTSPLYYLSRHPIMEALRNNILVQSRSRKLESIRDEIKAIALPSTDVFEKRAKIRLSSTYAKLAKLTISKIEQHVIKERLSSMPEMNLGTQVLTHIRSEMNYRNIDKSHGLIPPAPKPKVEKISYDGVPMW